MGNLIANTKAAIESTLNGTVLSWNSIYGLIAVAVIVFLAVRFCRRIGRMILSLIGFILIVEICHLIVFNTQIGTTIPFLQTIFRYSVLTALAQLFVGTPIADGLLWVQSAITGLFLQALSFVQGLPGIASGR